MAIKSDKVTIEHNGQIYSLSDIMNKILEMEFIMDEKDDAILDRAEDYTDSRTEDLRSDLRNAV